MPNTKKGHIRGIFGKNTPFFGPESCVFEIALVSLVLVGTYDFFLRPTQNPTLAGMDPLTIDARDAIIRRANGKGILSNYAQS